MATRYTFDGTFVSVIISSTTVLAVWGAVVSTIALVWHILRDIADRGRVSVKCYLGRYVGGIQTDLRTHLIYRVTNVGRRPVNVTHIGGAIQENEHFMLNIRTLPRTLQPGEYIVESSSDLSILDQRPKALWAIDSLGKHWKISRRNLRRLLSDHQKGATKKERQK